MAAPADPLSVECPRCGTDPGEPCLKPSGENASSPHKARQTHADKVAGEARARAEGDAEHRIDDPRWRRVYVASRLELEQRGAWTKLAAVQCEAMVRKMMAAAKAQAAADREPFVKGSMEQLVAHPAHSLANRYEAQALSLAKALKLTPDTRGTSAPVPDDELVDAQADADAEERDELSAVDELARRRKAKSGARKRAAGRRK